MDRVNPLLALERQRESAKLAFEAAYRVGDLEAEALAMQELQRLDREISRSLGQDGKGTD